VRSAAPRRDLRVLQSRTSAPFDLSCRKIHTECTKLARTIRTQLLDSPLGQKYAAGPYLLPNVSRLLPSMRIKVPEKKSNHSLQMMEPLTLSDNVQKKIINHSLQMMISMARFTLNDTQLARHKGFEKHFRKDSSKGIRFNSQDERGRLN
jgi:hypothetical protein